MVSFHRAALITVSSVFLDLVAGNRRQQLFALGFHIPIHLRPPALGSCVIAFWAASSYSAATRPRNSSSVMDTPVERSAILP
jgi:hypothetical protein